MSIRDLGYRAYDGPRLPHRSRYWVLVRRALLSAWTGSRQLRILLILSPLPAIIFGVVMYVQLKAMQLTGGALKIQGDLGNPSDLVFQCYFWSQMWFALPVSLVLAAPALANDLRTGALQLYFSRPVTRTHYVSGKVLPAALAVLIVTAGPALALTAERLALARSSADLTASLWLLPKILVFAPLYAGVFSLVPVALGSLGRRSAAVGGLWVGFFFVSWMVGSGLAEATDTPQLALLALPVDLRLLGEHLFGLKPSLDLHWGHPLLALCSYFGLAGLLIYRRLDKAGVM